MNIQDLSIIRKVLMNDLAKEDKKVHDTYREGVLTGLEMALTRIDRLMESEDESMSRQYGDDE